MESGAEGDILLGYIEAGMDTGGDASSPVVANEVGDDFEVGSCVAFTTSLDGSDVLLLRKCALHPKLRSAGVLSSLPSSSGSCSTYANCGRRLLLL